MCGRERAKDWRLLYESQDNDLRIYFNIISINSCEPIGAVSYLNIKRKEEPLVKDGKKNLNC